MKRLTIFALSAGLLAGCAYVPTPVTVVPVVQVDQISQVSLNQIQATQTRLVASHQLWQVKVPTMLRRLERRINRTRYVFSGSTPAGWDCSGMVRWGYQQLGIDLRHSASAQGNAGRWVKHPLPGDIVVWGWGHYFGHSGIYVGNGIAIHSGLHAGDWTSFIRVDSAAFRGYQVRFVRVLPDPVK